MILLDTHIWVWWVQRHPSLSSALRDQIEGQQSSGIFVSAFSCWEVAKLVAHGKIGLPLPPLEWLEAALTRPGTRLLRLSPQIAVESTQLPGDFHRDPADQIIVATARIHDLPLATLDGKIRSYPHVRIFGL